MFKKKKDRHVIVASLDPQGSEGPDRIDSWTGGWENFCPGG